MTESQADLNIYQNAFNYKFRSWAQTLVKYYIYCNCIQASVAWWLVLLPKKSNILGSNLSTAHNFYQN